MPEVVASRQNQVNKAKSEEVTNGEPSSDAAASSSDKNDGVKSENTADNFVEIAQSKATILRGHESEVVSFDCI